MELFGCPNTARDSVLVAEFPSPVYLTGSTLMPDGERVLVCGGFSCDEVNNCFTGDECFAWSPAADAWEASAAMTENLDNFILTLVPDLDNPGVTAPVPMALGNDRDTLILNQVRVYRTYKRDTVWFFK